MPYALILIGVVMVVTGTQNTYAQFATQLRSDSLGFAKFALAIGIVGAAGYVEDLRGLSRAFMGLIIISIVLANGKSGLFSNVSAALAQGPALITPANDATTQSNSSAVASGAISADRGIANQTSNLAGEPATSSGQAKANGWLNWFFGTNGSGQ